MVLGPIIKPAMIYPKTTGCFNFLNRRVTTAAVPNIRARSTISAGRCIIGFLQALEIRNLPGEQVSQSYNKNIIKQNTVNRVKLFCSCLSVY
jgi:hypothetical protein